MGCRTYYSFEATGSPGCQSGFGNEEFIATSTNPFNGQLGIVTLSALSGYSLTAYGITLVSVSLCYIFLGTITDCEIIRQASCRPRKPLLQVIILLLYNKGFG